MNVFIKVLRFLNEIIFDIEAKTLNFLPAIEQISNSCLLNFNLLSISIPKSFKSLFSHIFPIAILAQPCDAYLCLVSCSYFQTKLKLILRFALVTLMPSLNFHLRNTVVWKFTNTDIFKS